VRNPSLWLRRAYNRNLLTDEEVAQIRPLLDELAPRLNAYLNSIGNTTGEKKPASNNK